MATLVDALSARMVPIDENCEVNNARRTNPSKADFGLNKMQLPEQLAEEN
jgi:hypothetical protein